MRLVFVTHGFGGGSLEAARPADFGMTSSPFTIWLNLQASNIWVNSLTVGSDGVSPVEGRGDIVAGSPLWLYHQPIINQVATGTNSRVEGIGYDWRKPLRNAASGLASRINSRYLHYSRAENGGPVTEIVVVAHSMGGLIARLAYPLVATAPRAAWTKTITLGTPHGGSHAISRALDDIEFALGVMLGGWLNVGWAVWLANSTEENVRQMFYSWRSAGAVLPRGQGTQWASLDPNAELSYNGALYSHPSDSLNANIASRTADWELLDANSQTDTPRMVCLCGTGHDTEVRIENSSMEPGGFEWLSSDRGDSLVQFERAYLDGAVVQSFAGVTHAQLLNNGRVVQAVIDAINTDPDELPQGEIPPDRRRYQPGAPTANPPATGRIGLEPGPVTRTGRVQPWVTRGDP